MAYWSEQFYTEEEGVSWHYLLTELHVVELHEVSAPTLWLLQLVEHEQATTLEVPNPINMPNYCYFKDRCEMCVNGCEGDYPCEVSISPTHKVSCYRYYDGKRPDLEEVVEEELAEGKENGKEGE